MATIAEIRQQYPQYQDLSDQQLADSLYRKFYSDMPRADFDTKVGLAAAPQAQPSRMMGAFADMARSRGAELPTDADVQGYQRGAARGLRDPIDAGAQLVTRAGEMLPGAAGRYMQGERERVEQINREGEAQYQQQVAGTRGAETGRTIGNVLATAPIAAAVPATIPGGMIAGGTAAALQPVNTDDGSFWMDKLKQVGIGTAVGGLGTAAAKGISRLVSPQSTPQVRALVDEGVTPTPGQMVGGVARTMEEKATSIPFLGDAIKRAQMRGVESFNRASIDKALKPIGQRLDMKTAMGREAIDEAITKVTDAYDNLLPKMSLQADQKFLSDVASLRSLAQNLPKEGAEQFDRVLKSEILSKINPNTGLASGEALKRMQSEIGGKARNYLGSSSASERDLGAAFQELHNVLRGVIQRSNPMHAGTLAKNDEAYAMLLRIQKASTAAGSKEGVFSPAAMRSAVRAMDKSLNKRQFARGDALMQDFAESAESVMGPRIPDSGTAGRAMLPLSLPVALSYLDPMTASAAGAAMIPYTPMGQRALASLLTQRGLGAAEIAAIMKQLSPVAGAAAVPPAVGLLSP